MATQPAVLLDSYDVPGLSVLTSTVTDENPRWGAIYNPLSLAAAVPVYFHPLVDGDFLALFASRWTDATVGDASQSYLDYTESSVPSWAVITSGIGLRGAVSDILVRTPHTLAAACSKQNNLFTVGQDDDANNAVVSMYRVSTLGMITLQNEEIIPPVNEVVFSRGCYIDALFGIGALVLLGTDPDGKVYAARKNWSRIGTPGGWTYHGTKGWLEDIDLMMPMGMISAGPVSMAYRKGRLWMTVVDDDEGQRKSLLYTGKGFDSWKKTGDEIDLGDDDTYLGGGLYLQPQLNTNLAMDPTGSGVPYVASVKVINGDESGISTFWNLRSLV